MVWATFWAIFSQTHLVSLVTDDSSNPIFVLLSKKCNISRQKRFLQNYFDQQTEEQVNCIYLINENQGFQVAFFIQQPGANPTTMSYHAL
jgi:hypothetical protein